MFKAPIKVLHPLLTATQEGNYKGTEGFGAIPFDGIDAGPLQRERSGRPSSNNKNNEAFLDRIYIVKVPYCLRVSDEVKIYEKLLRTSSLAGRPARPNTLKMMAQFSVLTRIKEPENSKRLLARCASTTAKTSRTPTRKRQDATRSTATTPASTKA